MYHTILLLYSVNTLREEEKKRFSFTLFILFVVNKCTKKTPNNSIDRLKKWNDRRGDELNGMGWLGPFSRTKKPQIKHKEEASTAGREVEKNKQKNPPPHVLLMYLCDYGWGVQTLPPETSIMQSMQYYSRVRSKENDIRVQCRWDDIINGYACTTAVYV